MSKKRKKKGDNMSAVIERIVNADRAESDAFIKVQRKRLAQLQKIEQRKLAGKKIQRKRILKELQDAGILDESGNLAFPYSEQE